jgi:hypothetical protein
LPWRKQERAGPLAFSPDGKSFAAAGDSSVRVWEVAKLGPREDRKARGAAPAAALEATVTSRKAAYPLELGGKSAEEFARGVRADTLPPSPSVDLVVTFRNASANELTLYLDGSFESYLIGDGAMNHPEIPRQTGVNRGEVRMRPCVVLAPGGKQSLPLTTLDSFTTRDSGNGQQSFWLSPGEYTLYVKYHTQVDPAPEGWLKYEEGESGPGFGTIRAAPIRLKVVAEKK